VPIIDTSRYTRTYASWGICHTEKKKEHTKLLKRRTSVQLRVFQVKLGNYIRGWSMLQSRASITRIALCCICLGLNEEDGHTGRTRLQCTFRWVHQEWVIPTVVLQPNSGLAICWTCSFKKKSHIRKILGEGFQFFKIQWWYALVVILCCSRHMRQMVQVGR